ncbi:hypothetical protein T484DRAFT_1755277 [Baffinella frigidus]|nr:hypothetical protein T484DRAFT_1755277 [Cryptophyta sp. CCMP2293]
MVHPRDAAFDAPSSGHESLLLLRLRVNVAAATMWSCKQETTVSSRRAAGDSAAPPPPVSLELIGAPKEGEGVETSMLNSVDAWHEMSLRFDVAHDPAARASSDGDFFEPARRSFELDESDQFASSGAHKDDLYDDSDFSRLSSTALSVARTPTSSCHATSSSYVFGRLPSRPYPSENSESEVAP